MQHLPNHLELSLQLPYSLLQAALAPFLTIVARAPTASLAAVHRKVLGDHWAVFGETKVELWAFVTTCCAVSL